MVVGTTTMEHCRGCGAPGTARALVPVVRKRPLRRAAWPARLPGRPRPGTSSLEKSRTPVASPLPEDACGSSGTLEKA
jgi:hypothetical protein